MKGFELLKETFLRKSYLPVIHLIVFAIYLLLYVPANLPVEWGRLLFVCSGLLLPLVLTQGIFGDDIASGRIRVLVTKPLQTGELYLWRLLGVSVQWIGHALCGATIILVLHAVTNKGKLDNFALWCLCSGILYATFASLSMTVSICVTGGRNFMVLVFGIVLLGTISVLAGPHPTYASDSLVAIIKHVFPPVQLLFQLANSKTPLPGHIAVRVLHGGILIGAYTLIGTVLLHTREFAHRES